MAPAHIEYSSSCFVHSVFTELGVTLRSIFAASLLTGLGMSPKNGATISGGSLGRRTMTIDQNVFPPTAILASCLWSARSALNCIFSSKVS